MFYETLPAPNNPRLRFRNESSIVFSLDGTGLRFVQRGFMEQPPEEPSRLEKINHAMRIVLGVVSVLVFVVGMIAFFIKYSKH